MKLFFPSWLLPHATACFTSNPCHLMDELIWGSSGSSSRLLRHSLESLVVYDADEEPIIPMEPHILPTPTDVPVPEPFDVPVPEPMDIPPPNPGDVPLPKPRPVP
ncbi:MAG: hypothetical protein AB7G28_10090 [Pirellulales bacterium]